MSDIPLPQGAIKFSEVAADNAETIANTPVGNDAMSLFESLQAVVGDLGQRAGFILTSSQGYPTVTSPGTIGWDGTTILFSGSTNIILKILQSPTAQPCDLVMLGSGSNGETTFASLPLSNGEILYIELDRANLSASPLLLHNAVSGGSVFAGATIKVATTLPASINTNPSGGGPQGTIAIPIAIAIAGSIYWIPHGIFWPTNTSSPLGAIQTVTTMPVGAMVPYTTFGAPSPYGYQTLSVLAPGWALCNGAVITDPNSSLVNPTRNSDGTPSPSFNPALDNFTPQLNGPYVTWSNTVTWNAGDYVYDGSSTNYVAIQAVPTGIALANTSYWQPESTYNNLSNTNPYNKYRTATANEGIPTVPRGSTQSYSAGSGSAYGGSLTFTLSQAQLPNCSFPVNDPGHTHQVDAYTYNDNFGSNTPVSGGYGPYEPYDVDPNTTGISVSSGGSGTPVPVAPPYFNAIYIVRIY